MSGSNGIMRTDHRADIGIALLWQYQNATRLKGLIESKQSWLDDKHRQFWEDWTIYIFGALSLDAETSRHLSDISDPDNPAYNPQSPDYPTAQLWIFGLSVWGKILNLSRTYMDGGTKVQISTMMYFVLLKGELLKQHMGSSIPEINRWLKLVFGSFGNAYVVDNGNMTFYIVIDFEMSESDYNMLTGLNLVPRPAGVGVSLLNVNYNLKLYAEEFDGEYGSKDTLSGDYDEDGQTVEDNPGGLLAPYAEI